MKVLGTYIINDESLPYLVGYQIEFASIQGTLEAPKILVSIK